MISPSNSGSRRPGLTLLEVLIALGIFLMSLVAIVTLISMGADAARDVQDQARAAQLGQAKLAEVVAGVVPLSGQSDAPFDEDPAWTWSLDAQQGDIAGLWKVTVRVSRERSDGSRVECSFDRMLLDPSLRGSALDAATIAANNTANSSNSSTSGSSSSSSTSNTPSTSGAAGGGSAATGKTSGAAGGGAAAGKASGSGAAGGMTGASGAGAAKTTGGSPASSSGSKGPSKGGN